MSDAPAGKVEMIQACCAGYQGKPATVYGALDTTNDILVISKIAMAFRSERFQNCRVVANCSVPSVDAIFTEEHFKDAILQYQERASSQRVLFKDEAKRATPGNAMQLLKVTESGRQYELAPSITNEQVSVLMMAWHAYTANAIRTALQFGELLQSMKSGALWTV